MYKKTFPHILFYTYKRKNWRT